MNMWHLRPVSEMVGTEELFIHMHIELSSFCEPQLEIHVWTCSWASLTCVSANLRKPENTSTILTHLSEIYELTVKDLNLFHEEEETTWWNLLLGNSWVFSFVEIQFVLLSNLWSHTHFHHKLKRVCGRSLCWFMCVTRVRVFHTKC